MRARLIAELPTADNTSRPRSWRSGITVLRKSSLTPARVVSYSMGADLQQRRERGVVDKELAATARLTTTWPMRPPRAAAAESGVTACHERGLRAETLRALRGLDGHDRKPPPFVDERPEERIVDRPMRGMRRSVRQDNADSSRRAIRRRPCRTMKTRSRRRRPTSRQAIS